VGGGLPGDGAKPDRQPGGRTGYQAYSPDYRLAPEHPFPAAIHDGLSAYRTLLEAGEDPSMIALTGDSAGGGLTVTTLLNH
jgi:monoterpene epsilon-lactone hydrolase